MTTRRSKDDSIFNQSRFASSPEFERGLIANLVAKRCALVDSRADRELIWFVQYLSHQEGGLKQLVQRLLAEFPLHFQTRQMADMKLRPENICGADQVREIRRGFAFAGFASFPLRGEHYFNGKYFPLTNDAGQYDELEWEEVLSVSRQHPATYPAAIFFNKCRIAAAANLVRWLEEMCLDPATDLAGPWYFPGLVSLLREFQVQQTTALSAATFITSLGRKVYDTLDYTAYCRGLTLLQGDSRRGKSFAARAWCAQHPGKARFVEVPPGNDDAAFFRALARSLGLGNFLNYKVVQIRERVESVLLTGDILLCLDEAQRLWPQCNLRYKSARPNQLDHDDGQCRRPHLYGFHTPIFCFSESRRKNRLEFRPTYWAHQSL